MSFSCPAQFAALPSDLFLLQPQFPYHLFKAVLLCFQDLVQTLEFLDQKRRQECTLLTQLGKSSPLTMSGTFNMSYVEPWGVQFHHTFVQRQLEGIEGWLRISRHPEVPVRLPGTWKSQTCSLHRSALLHIYGRSKAPWESWTQHACTISRHPHVAGAESLDRNVTAPALLHLKRDISTSSALLPIPTGTGKHDCTVTALHSLISLPLSLC